MVSLLLSLACLCGGALSCGSLPSLSGTAAGELKGHLLTCPNSQLCESLHAALIASSHDRLSPPPWSVSIFSSSQYQRVLLNDKGVCFLVVYCERLRNNECCDTSEGMLVLIVGTLYQRADHAAGLHLGRCLPSLESY